MPAFLNASGAGMLPMTTAAEDIPPRDQRDADHAGVVDETIELADRRRPGRKEVNPALILLLRTPAEESKADLIAEPEETGAPVDPEHDALRPTKGILLAVLLSLPFWSIVAVLVAWMRR